MINENFFLKYLYTHNIRYDMRILLKLSTKYLFMFYSGPSQNSKHFGV